ncbi:hypothetical protein ACFWAR_00110 [Streptomyces sp. NPDC059917]|uniref:hypothetical protein n=1 Tax=Streptomyces sp. NPDC059917 TaxID=3347002 RepID=UPI0036644928
MNLKRMAVVAAAAVVGPTVLMATPAMADEVKNTAVTTPDTDLTKDAAPVADKTDKAETPAPVVPVTPPVVAPVVPPVPDAKPAPAPAPAPGVDTGKDLSEGDEIPVANGPKLTLKGLPASFTAGGAAQNFTLHVDNSKGGNLKDYALGLSLFTNGPYLTSEQIKFEAYLADNEDNEGWQLLEAYGSEEAYGLSIGSGAIGKGDVFDIKLRISFAKGAPTTKLGFHTVGWSQVEGEHIVSNDDMQRAQLQAAGSNNGGGNTGGDHGNGNGNGNGNTGGNTNNPKPDGGTTTPIVDHNGGNSAGGNTTGGELAETGADAATSWALGGAGVALAMGAALVAGTGRRRRPTA